MVFITQVPHEDGEGFLRIGGGLEVADGVDGFVVVEGYRFQLLPGNHILDADGNGGAGDTNVGCYLGDGELIPQNPDCGCHPSRQAAAIGGTKGRLRSILGSGCCYPGGLGHEVFPCLTGN